jgi:excisionase family DNA binding protein
MPNRSERGVALLTVGEAADELRLSRPFVYRLIESGQLRACRFGATLRVDAQDLREYVDRSRTARGDA